MSRFLSLFIIQACYIMKLDRQRTTLGPAVLEGSSTCWPVLGRHRLHVRVFIDAVIEISIVLSVRLVFWASFFWVKIEQTLSQFIAIIRASLKRDGGFRHRRWLGGHDRRTSLFSLFPQLDELFVEIHDVTRIVWLFAQWAISVPFTPRQNAIAVEVMSFITR